jgi:NAD(P)-dependent dehydrogenase (short-subunit alcohol dehydrogenase family)
MVLVAAPADSSDLSGAAESLADRSIPTRGLAGDVALPETARQAVAVALSEFGQLDILVNNAGFSYFEELLKTPVEHLERLLAVNVVGTFLMSQEAVRAMVQRKRGAIVNAGSISGIHGDEFMGPYNATKAAVISLTRSMAVDCAQYGIRVNAVSPGWVRTRTTAPTLADPEQWAKYRTRVPVDRAANPEEVAAVYAFLASDEAAYVTGANFVCDGGLTAGWRWSNWAAVDPPPTVGIPDVPTRLGRPAVLEHLAE